MKLILCGLFTSLAIVVCVLYDETLMFNMMMCVFCVLALTSLWTSDSDNEKSDKTVDINDDVTQSTKQD